MCRIGIMGGTFNPIHKGHIEIANAAYKQYLLDEVWFMPNHIPAYKNSDDVVSGEHRLNMISAAIKEYDYFKLSDFELKRSGKTYSYETFTLLKQEYPEAHFYFIMGADSLFYFEKWVKPDIILKNTDILVAARDSANISDINNKIEELKNLFGTGNFDIINCPQIDCSSSMIRNNCRIIKSHASLILDYSEALAYIDKYLDPSVKQYIIKNEIY